MRLRQLAELLWFGPRALLELLHHQVVEFTAPHARLRRGRGSYVFGTCSIKFPKRIIIGRRASIGPGTRLWASPNATLTIGDDVLVGPNVTLLTANHGISDRAMPIVDQASIERDVTIERGVWLGANVVVLPGVTIGEGSVAAAGAVVTADVAPYTIVCGVPARVLRARTANAEFIAPPHRP